MDNDRGADTSLDPLVREQEMAAAREAAGIGGTPPRSNADPAHRPLEEAGQGEAEGFELAERELVERASHGDERSTPETDAFTPEEDRSDAVYGEADEAETPDGSR
jgi:hypothetical protein